MEANSPSKAGHAPRRAAWSAAWWASAGKSYEEANVGDGVMV